MNSKIFIIFTLLLLPATARAQENRDIFNVLSDFLNVIDSLILLSLSLAFLFFIWGLAVFILRAGDEAERKKGKNMMVWGVIAMTVMVSIWGIVALLQSFVLGDGPSGGLRFEFENPLQPSSSVSDLEADLS